MQDLITFVTKSSENMIQTKTLSIIVPTYNMEAYLAQCLDSLMPAVQEGDVEVLVVSDGSKDGSVGIAKGYSAKQPDGVRLIEKENGGYGSAVNRGLQEATGKYVKVLDADDWFESDALLQITSALKNLDVDVAVAPFIRQFEGGGRKEVTVDIPTGQVIEVEKADRSFIESGTMIITSHHNYIFRLEMLRSMGYTQLEHCLYTDAQWSFTPFAAARTVYAFNTPLYVYRLGREGQSMDSSVRKAKFRDEIAVAKAMVSDFASAQFATDANRYLLENKLALRLRLIYRDILCRKLQDDTTDLAELDQMLCQKAPTVANVMTDYIISRPMLPIRFVERWRSNHDDILVKLGGWAYRLFH